MLGFFMVCVRIIVNDPGPCGSSFIRADLFPVARKDSFFYIFVVLTRIMDLRTVLTNQITVFFLTIVCSKRGFQIRFYLLS